MFLAACWSSIVSPCSSTSSCCLAGLFTVLVSNAYLEEHQLAREDFFALLLLCLSGMMMLVHAGSFVMLIIGLETMSLAVYALVACWSGNGSAPRPGSSTSSWGLRPRRSCSTAWP